MSTTQIADLKVRLSADRATFERDLAAASGRLNQFGQQAAASQQKLGGFHGMLGQASSAAAAMPGPLGSITSGLSGQAGLLGSINPLWLAFGAGITTAMAGLKHGMDVVEQSEIRLSKYQALLQATGYSSDFTAGELDKMARSVALSTLASTWGVGEAQAVLLTFKGVTGDTFTSAISLAQDMAATMGGDVKSAAMQLGKALEMPTEGINALRRSGVSFTAGQREQIKAMEEGGRIADAQRLILRTLQEQLGGTGTAEASGLAGALDTNARSWDGFWEAAADRVGLAEKAKSALDGVSAKLQAMRDLIAEPVPYEGMGLDWIQDQYDRATTGLAATNSRLEELQDYRYASWLSAEGRERDHLLEQKKLQEENLANLQTALDREQGIAAAREKSEQAAADREAERQADQAAQQRKKAEEEAKKAAERLKSLQSSNAGRLSGLDSTYADDKGKLALEHESRLAQIQQMQLSELEIRRRGFDSIEQLRAEYAERENAYYAQQQQAYLDKLDEKHQKEIDKDKSSQDALLKADIDRYDKQRQYQQQAAQQMLSFTQQTLSITTDALEQTGHQNNTIMKMMLAAQKLLAIPSIIVAGQQAEASAAAFAAMTGGLLGAETARNLVRAQTYLSVGIVAGQAIAGMAHNGIETIPDEGTWLLNKGERVYTNKSAERIDAMYDAVMSGGAGSGASIQQHFYFDSTASESLQQQLAQAAQDGAQQAMNQITQDFATRGPLRRTLNV